MQINNLRVKLKLITKLVQNTNMLIKTYNIKVLNLMA